ncbi:MAG: alpha-L-rhamnosidase C-terminal domain-containing protein [Bacteroidota bacterium]|nr:alpha-L-rhamnosidase C-terminal domain-containing protein [Bacteroidota bacterium]
MRPSSFIFFLLLIFVQIRAEGQEDFAQAKWIWTDYNAEPNSWAVFEKQFTASTQQKLIINIAVDSKYWLWLNDTLIVREGGLKRGPTPYDTYFDQVLIDNRLVSSSNKIKILVWYWGVSGSSHKSSGKPGLLFEMKNEEGAIVLKSDDTWLAGKERSYCPTILPKFNDQYILSEWPVKYDASLKNKTILTQAVIAGDINCSPWNRLYKRPIPFWKDTDLKSYSDQPGFPINVKTDTLIRCQLPYNMQVYPFIRLNAKAGKEIVIKAERDWKSNSYVTDEGVQSFEVPAWGNGHFVEYLIPADVEVLDLKYRETSYDSDITGFFECSDNDLNRLWLKSARSTILNMRDNYMDCPDRERSQWMDCALISEFSYYSLDRKSDLLTQKMIHEFIDWRTPEGILWSAIPTGRFPGKYREFPYQSLLGIGEGIYEYYMQSGDSVIIKQIYEPVRKYLLEVWELESTGLVKHRGPWKTEWGAGTQNYYDWGSADQDWYLSENCWYYLCLKRASIFAAIAGKTDDIPLYAKRMQSIETAFDPYFWHDKEFRSPNYTGKTDERGNAMSIYSGLATRDKWDDIALLISKNSMAGIGFEKFMLEALYIAGRDDLAYTRLKNRYQFEIESSYTTMPEHFGEDSNHGWGGAPLLIAGKYIAGIFPSKPGYKQFIVKPEMGKLRYLKTSVPTVKGNIHLEIEREKGRSILKINVPDQTSAKLEIPKDFNMDFAFSTILINGKKVGSKVKSDEKCSIDLQPGEWLIEVK